MSSSLNQPPLVAVAGVGALSLLPVLEQAAQQAPFLTLKLVNLAAYALDLWAVSLPGRIDGRIVEDMEESNKKKKDDDDDDDDESEERKLIQSFLSRGRSLVTPAGWAFAIWGPIFLGEMILVTAGQYFLLENNRSLAPRLVDMTAPYLVANVCQSLWAASFRPKYKKGWTNWLSVALLSSTAFSLSQCHKHMVIGLLEQKIRYNTLRKNDVYTYLVYGLPISLHFGWTTAASLVDFNGSLSITDASDKTVHRVGHVSVLAATAMGMYTTIRRHAPVYGAVIAWALAAIASSNNNKGEKDTSGAKQLQRRLSQLGAILTGGCSTVMAILIYMSKNSNNKRITP